MIIDCISDLHGFYPKLDGGDLLIIAGDLTRHDTIEEYFKLFQWIANLPYRKKIVIGGNHDNLAHEQDILSIPKADFDYLCDSGTEFEGLKIWGTPWTKTFKYQNPFFKAFTLETESQLDKKWKSIPHDIDILVSHSPFLHILDQNRDGYSCGSYTLREAVDGIKPKLFVCGHIHEQGGQMILYKHEGPNTICVNSSIVDENYEMMNKPVRVELKL